LKKLTREDGASPDVVADNIERLREIFPEVFADGAVDFDALKETLGEYVDDREERYSFTWHGKARARQIAQMPSTGTLRPCPEESVNWDTTKNIFIEGDNLEVLKLLQKSYHRKVKMIYIDPPYNTGKEFIYPDKWQDNLDTYLRYTGQVDDEGFKLSANAETGGRYHTNWLNMMYPRLKLARNLLRDDGVIFVSIDNHEASHLRLLCSEIFGEENFRNMIVVRRGIKNVQAQFDTISALSSGHEHLLCYSARSDTRLAPLTKRLDVDQAGKWDTFWWGTDRPTMRYRIFGNKPETGQWRWSEERTNQAIENYEFYLRDFSDMISLDDYFSEHRQSTNKKLDFVRENEDGVVQYYVPPTTFRLISDNWMDITTKGNAIGFDTEKHIDYISRIVEWIAEDGDLVLDFFAGSGTIGHAVCSVNERNGGRRRYILVQLPEPIEDGEYRTIADMTKARLEKLHKGMQSQIPVLDGRYKTFQLASSNIKPWDADFDTMEQDLLAFVDNIKPDRSEDDVLYELLLKYGLDLAIPTETRTVEERTVTVIGAGALIVCLADDITLEVVSGIAALKDELKPEVMRVVFKDSGFKDDVAKTNAAQILKQAGIDDVKSL
jgi:adenine-specific DNA-methyltransferase